MEDQEIATNPVKSSQLALEREKEGALRTNAKQTQERFSLDHYCDIVTIIVTICDHCDIVIPKYASNTLLA